jgi:hypothetical protein
MSSFAAPAPGETKHEEDVSRDVVHSSMPERDVASGFVIRPPMMGLVTDSGIRGGEAAQRESAQFSGVRLPLDNQAAGPMEEDAKYHGYDGRPSEGRASENEALIPASEQIWAEGKLPQANQEPISAKIVAKYLIDNGREGVLQWLHALLQPKQISMTDASTQTLKEASTQTGEDEVTMHWTGLEGPSLLPLVHWQDQRSLLPLIPFPNPEEGLHDQGEDATNLDALLMAVDMVEEGEEGRDVDPALSKKRMRRNMSMNGIAGSLDSAPYPSFIDTGFRPLASYPFLHEEVGGSVRSELTSGANPDEMPVIVASLNANAERLQAR